MARLKEIAELAHRQVFPASEAEAAITLEEFIATAETILSNEILINYYNTRNIEGEFVVDGRLVSSKEYDVADNVIDISDISPIYGLPNNGWLLGVQSRGSCNDCVYIRTDFALNSLLCDDEGFENVKTYYPMGKKIIFPMGTFSNKVVVNFIGSDTGEDDYEIGDGSVALAVRTKLVELYSKTGKEDIVNNSNPT